ncbi:family B DNA polymerase, partial [Collinsella sp. Sow4_E3]|uniref:family B DNA polymerase n=1 Tax=Collinsella sp. Sow4_E3 TaxID=3438776 RepID=UPI003F939AEC
MDERKVVKNEMIKLIGSGVPKSDIRVKVLDQRQKVLKLLANSFYGAYAEKSFIFYNKDAAPSVTYNGRLIIGYTLYLFETMLMDNHWFTEPDELFVYVTACKMKVQDSSLDDLGENPNLPSNIDEIRKEVKRKLVSYCA